VTAEVQRNGPKMGRRASERSALAGGGGQSHLWAEPCARKAEEGEDVAASE